MLLRRLWSGVECTISRTAQRVEHSVGIAGWMQEIIPLPADSP